MTSITVSSPIVDIKVAAVAANRQLQLTLDLMGNRFPELRKRFKDERIVCHHELKDGQYKSCVITSASDEHVQALMRCYLLIDGSAELERAGLARHLPICFMSDSNYDALERAQIKNSDSLAATGRGLRLLSGLALGQEENRGDGSHG